MRSMIIKCCPPSHYHELTKKEIAKYSANAAAVVTAAAAVGLVVFEYIKTGELAAGSLPEKTISLISMGGALRALAELNLPQAITYELQNFFSGRSFSLFLINWNALLNISNPPLAEIPINLNSLSTGFNLGEFYKAATLEKGTEGIRSIFELDMTSKIKNRILWSGGAPWQITQYTAQLVMGVALVIIGQVNLEDDKQQVLETLQPVISALGCFAASNLVGNLAMRIAIKHYNRPRDENLISMIDRPNYSLPISTRDKAINVLVKLTPKFNSYINAALIIIGQSFPKIAGWAVISAGIATGASGVVAQKKIEHLRKENYDAYKKTIRKIEWLCPIILIAGALSWFGWGASQTSSSNDLIAIYAIICAIPVGFFSSSITNRLFNPENSNWLINTAKYYLNDNRQLISSVCFILTLISQINDIALAKDEQTQFIVGTIASAFFWFQAGVIEGNNVSPDRPSVVFSPAIYQMFNAYLMYSIFFNKLQA